MAEPAGGDGRRLMAAEDTPSQPSEAGAIIPTFRRGTAPWDSTEPPQHGYNSCPLLGRPLDSDRPAQSPQTCEPSPGLGVDPRSHL